MAPSTCFAVDLYVKNLIHCQQVVNDLQKVICDFFHKIHPFVAQRLTPTASLMTTAARDPRIPFREIAHRHQFW